MNNRRISISDNFSLDEFLSREFYQNLERQVRIAQFIRTTSGQGVTINNWWHGRNLNNRGFRFNTNVGSPTSQHKQMNAIDINIGNMTGQQMYDWAVNNAKALFDLGVRRIETPTLTPTWLHLDCMPHNERAILIIDLTRVIGRIPI